MNVLRDASDGILPVTRVAVEIEKQLRSNAYEIPEQDIEFSNTSSAKKGIKIVLFIHIFKVLRERLDKGFG